MDFLPSWQTVITVASVLAATVSFLLIAIPFLRRSEKKERYRSVIEKKRKQLIDQAKQNMDRRVTAPKEEASAAKSIAMIYKMQQLIGDSFTQVRNVMLQAGIREPTAPIIYIVLRIVLPVVFAVCAVTFFSVTEKEIKDGTKTLVTLGVILFGFFLPRIAIKNIAAKRQQEIQEHFPDALDMMLICVQGGIGIEAAINRIAETIAEHSEVLAEELGILSAELGMLSDRKSAFQGFSGRVGSPAARSFATSMLQAEQYGTSVSKAIRVLADESRDQRMALAEQKAAGLPPKLTVPMILFFLPALFVVILGPAYVGSHQ